MPSLTLCVIARDEEEMLPGCLESAAPAVDRMLVVDTGSSDGTRAVAERLGAEVIAHAWRDDFAAARNAALEHVSSGYVLVLDADERLTRSGARRLRRAARRGEIDLGLMPLHQASSLSADYASVLCGEARIGEPLLVPRFLRRTPDLRWEGIVHESVGEWALRARRVVALDAPIVHYGRVPELRRDLGKQERNLHLLERRCELEPDNPMPRCYLAVELRRRGEGRALREARRAWETLEQQRERGVDHHDPVFPATVLGELLLSCGDLDEAESVLDTCLRWEEHPNLHLLSGLCREVRAVSLGGSADGLLAAEEHYGAALAPAMHHFASELMPGATSWEAATRRGTVRLLLGRAEEARADFGHALESRPGHREAELGGVEARIAAGDAAGALEEIGRLVAVQDPDVWLLAALAARATGASDDLALFTARARRLRSQGPCVARHRERTLVELERDVAPEQAASQADPAAETRVFAWPRYDRDGDLEVLIGEYAKRLARKAGVVLCLRHDAELDGDVESAVGRFESACERAFPDGAPLQVLLLDQAPDEPSGWARLARAGDVALELPSSLEEGRGGFLRALGARRVGSGQQLDEALASRSPSAPASDGGA